MIGLIVPLIVASGATGDGAVAANTAGARAGGLHLKRLGKFDFPVYVDQPPGNSRLVFVAEWPGTIRVLRRGHELDKPFLQIRNLVGWPQGQTEQGFLSMAFAPDYSESRRFYVSFTNKAKNFEVDAFRTSKRSPTRANPRSRRKLFDVYHPYEQHYGGQLEFGPDGLLYISTGDGGDLPTYVGDPQERAQNVHSLLGKLLRVDPKPGRRHGRPYTIPHGNPFVGKEGRDQIFALGLRNPWRFSFDRKKRRIVIGDVGLSAWEEVDYEKLSVANGANFGWDAFEGKHPFDSPLDDEAPPPPNPDFPIHEYSHANGKCAVIGGYVVRDKRLSSLYGRYLYADYCTGEVRSFIPRLGGARDDRTLGIDVSGLDSFGEGYHGRIYLSSLDGPVYELVQR